MESLRVGDTVRSSSGEQSVIFGFTHRDSLAQARFKRLDVDCGGTGALGALNLTVTPDHFVFLQSGRALLARQVKVGDLLLHSSCSEARVTQVSTVVRQGLFNPQTLSGTISVEGFVVSCYTAFLRPRIAHFLLLPLRCVYQVFRYPLVSDGDFSLDAMRIRFPWLFVRHQGPVES